MNLTFERAIELNRDMVTEEHLIIHSKNVMAAMEAMAITKKALRKKP